jgi:hypothetical protein
MNKKSKWTLALLTLTAGAGLTVASVEPAAAQVTLGCRLTPGVPQVLGGVVQRNCADGSATASVRFVSTTGNVHRYNLRVDLKKAGAFSASVGIGGVQGEPVLQDTNGSACIRSDGNPGTQAVTFSCDIPVANSMTMRFVAGDGVGG